MDKVKKYLFDFAILFIGITLAFYVENFRQNMGDEEDLQRYLHGLTDDLKSDSVIYIKSKGTLELSIQLFDSLLLSTDNDKIEDSIKIKLLANSTLLIYDLGIDNNTNYKALVNSGQLKLISDINYRKGLKDYYRSTEVWLKNYENEFQAFRTIELFPFLNNQIDQSDFRWDNGLKISKVIKTDTKIFNTRQFRNYLYRTRQFLSDFKNTMDELREANNEMLNDTRKKLKYSN
ncbi:MAG: hypothetical protein ACK5TU_03920 [Cyclobacteriaceae bacterium]|jgi:hypothetical protein